MGKTVNPLTRSRRRRAMSRTRARTGLTNRQWRTKLEEIYVAYKDNQGALNRALCAILPEKFVYKNQPKTL